MEKQTSKSSQFFGTWKLDPTQSQYEFGAPPQSGIYKIEPDGNKLIFSIDWVADDGKSYQLTYSGIPDGKDYAYENPAIVDAMSLTQVDESRLDSTSKKDGHVILHASRVLSENRTEMIVTQSGTTPDGKPYSNVSVYFKQ